MYYKDPMNILAKLSNAKKCGKAHLQFQNFKSTEPLRMKFFSMMNDKGREPSKKYKDIYIK